MKVSVVIPVHNEQDCIKKTAEALIHELALNGVPYEIIIVNDNSTDNTPSVLNEIVMLHNEVKVVCAQTPKGFGRAIQRGLESVNADIVVIYMGDGSDDPKDVVRYYQKILEGYDCVFGSRFMKGSKTTGYPQLKLMLNRLGNTFIQTLFLIDYNDVSNAFKAYRIEVIRAMQPLVSQYFNITVEMPLKAIISGFSYAVIPITWNGRGSGVSKYHIRELSRKYFFSILYVWLEKILLKEEIRKMRSSPPI